MFWRSSEVLVPRYQRYIICINIIGQPLCLCNWPLAHPTNKCSTIYRRKHKHTCCRTRGCWAGTLSSVSCVGVQGSRPPLPPSTLALLPSSLLAAGERVLLLGGLLVLALLEPVSCSHTKHNRVRHNNCNNQWHLNA